MDCLDRLPIDQILGVGFVGVVSRSQPRTISADVALPLFLTASKTVCHDTLKCGN